MLIEAATPRDLAVVRAIYDYARDVQRARHSIQWPEFSDATILSEIEKGRLMRVSAGDAISGIFSVAYEDPAIWGPHERGVHIYLHRIARAAASPAGLVDLILVWADAECQRLGREGLRMDTWARNTALIAFYGERGFRLVEERRLGDDPSLAAHYHGNSFALLERARTI
jgi:hypothetical protein